MSEKRKLNRISSDSKTFLPKQTSEDDVDSHTQKGVSTVDPLSKEFRIKRGRALIISNNYYGQASERFGNEYDRNAMDSFLKSIGCDVTIIEDAADGTKPLTKSEIEKTVLDLSKDKDKKLNRYDCLIVVIMCHGYIYQSTGDEFIEAEGGNVRVKWIIERFSNNNCISLLGKPKLFFLQHCRGGKKDRGIFVMPNGRRTSCDSSKVRSIAKMSEYFIANASFEGYQAYLSIKGSWFIQALVEVFRKRIPEGIELHQMMLEVHRKVSEIDEFEKDVKEPDNNEPLPDEDDIVKEAPCTKTTLTKPVYFEMVNKETSFDGTTKPSFNFARPNDFINKLNETDF